MINSNRAIETQLRHSHKLLPRIIAKILGHQMQLKGLWNLRYPTAQSLLEAIKQNAGTLFPHVNLPLLLYCLKRLDTSSSEQGLPDLQIQSVSQYQQLMCTPRLETVSQQTLHMLAMSNCSGCRKVHLKNQSIHQIIKSQQNKPIFIISLNELYLEQLQKMLCVTGNSGNSYILVALKYKPQHILQGFQTITKGEAKKIITLCQEAQSALLPRNHLKIKVGFVELTDLGDLIQAKNQKSKKFVIKISVNSRPQKQKVFFHLEYKLSNLRSTYHFFKAVISQQGSPNIKKIEGTEIYQQIVRVASIKQISQNIFEQCQFYESQQSLLLTDLLELINQEVVTANTLENNTKEYFFPDDSAELLLYCCKLFYNEKFDDEFRDTYNENQVVILIQISENEKNYQIFETIVKILKATNKKWRYFKPIPHFQKLLNQFKVKKSPNIKIYQIYYFIFEGEYDFLVESIKKNLNQDDQSKFLIQKISRRMVIGLPITESEMQHLKSLIFHKFVEIPIIKKTKINGVGDVSYRQVEFTFRKQDMNIALYVYALLIFCKKRPMAIQ